MGFIDGKLEIPCHLFKKSEIKAIRFTTPYPFLFLRKQHTHRRCQLWLSPNRFLQQPRIVSNLEKPLQVFFSSWFPNPNDRGVWILFSHLIWSCWFLWWCVRSLFTGSIQGFRKDNRFDIVLGCLKKFWT